MKKSIILFAVILMAAQLFASGSKDTSNEMTIGNMYVQVQRRLGHTIEKYEKNIIDTTYLYYNEKCDGKWTLELWDTAVNKAVELCHNKVAITASKAGNFGEKLLQTLIVTTEDIVKGLNDWVENGSEEYKERHQ